MNKVLGKIRRDIWLIISDVLHRGGAWQVGIGSNCSKACEKQPARTAFQEPMGSSPGSWLDEWVLSMSAVHTAT